MKKNTVTILGIETSCDETAASVLRGDPNSKSLDFSILSNVVKSQIQLHASMGGVVPEIAARAHVANIVPVVKKALEDAFPELEASSYKLVANLDYIAVTTGPGLIASLIVGTEFAKALAYASSKKMLPTNHMEGHMYSPFGEYKLKVKSSKSKSRKQITSIKKVKYPVVSLVVSGGHTMVVLVKDEKHYKVLGETVDDAAGEAFDKVARLLGLPYPGGPEISKLAEKGAASIEFPRPMLYSKDYNFSFSGLKTSVLYHLRDKGYVGLKKGKMVKLKNIPPKVKADIARSFEEAVIDILVTKTIKAAKQYKAKSITLGGGVSANKRLRASLEASTLKLEANFLVPPFELCTDNAAMIAIAAYMNLRNGKKPQDFKRLKANSSWEIK